MKKILAISILVSLFSEAYDVKNTHWADSGSTRHKVYSIQCSNGNNIIAQYYPSSNTYHSSGGRAHSTLNQAVSSSCGTTSHSNNKYKKLSRSTLYCKNKSTMIRILKSDFEYSLSGLGGQGRNSDCGNAAEDTNVIVVNMYDGKSKGLIDDYARIKAGNGHYYVKKSELLKR